MHQESLSVLFQIIGAVGFAAMILILSVLFGKRARLRQPANIPYECGMIPEGEGAPMFNIKFYVVAMLFVVFDLEVVFLYPWAINFRDLMEVPGSFLTVTIFLVVLGLAYLYAWGKGVLTWHQNPSPSRAVE